MSLVVATLITGAAAGELGRVKLQPGEGCYILPRNGCCQYIDGRTDASDVLDQPCLPARFNYPSGNECEPAGVVYHHGWSASAASCDSMIAAAEPSSSGTALELSSEASMDKLGRTKLPAGQGCYTLTKDHCCAYIDGRTDASDVLDQPCLPARFNYPSGNECEPAGVVYHHGWSASAASCDSMIAAAEPSSSGTALELSSAASVEVGRSKLPAGTGCYILTKDHCCDYIDGRTDASDVLDQPCLRAYNTFPSGNQCEPAGVVFSHKWSDDAASCNQVLV